MATNNPPSNAGNKPPSNAGNKAPSNAGNSRGPSSKSKDELDEAKIQAELTKELKGLAGDIPGASFLTSRLEQTKEGGQLNAFIGDTIGMLAQNAVPIAVREAALVGGEHLKAMAGEALGKDKEIQKRLVDIGIDATIVLAESAKIALDAKSENDAQRAKDRQALAKFAEAYGVTLKPSVIVPELKHKNSVLATLEEKRTEQFKGVLPDVAASAAISYAQYWAHKKHNENVQELVKEKKTELTDAKEKDFNTEKEKIEETREKAQEKLQQNLDATNAKKIAEIEKLDEAHSKKENPNLGTHKDKLEQEIAKNNNKFEKDSAANAKTFGDKDAAAQKKYDQDIAKINEAAQKASGPRSAIFDLADPKVAKKGEPFGDITTYGSKYINPTTISVGAAAIIGKNGGKMLAEASGITERVVAAELIFYLNEQFEQGLIRNGTIHLDALKLNHNIPEEWGHEMKLESFIGAIFNTNFYDQTGKEIPKNLHDNLQQINQSIASALTSPSSDLVSDSKLDPLALIDLVGGGKIIDNKGMHIANLEVVQKEIEAATQKMPIQLQIDTSDYMQKLSSSHSSSDHKVTPNAMVGNLKGYLNSMDSDTHDFMISLAPVAFWRDEVGLSEGKVIDSRARAAEYSVDTMKQVVTELNEKPELIASLNRTQLKTLRDADEAVKNGDDDKLLEQMRDRDFGSLSFTILSCKPYIDELANGKKLMGYDFINNQNAQQTEVNLSEVNPRQDDIVATSAKAKQGFELAS